MLIQKCDFCGDVVTLGFIEWMGAGWRYNPIINKHACSKKECRGKLIQMMHRC